MPKAPTISFDKPAAPAAPVLVIALDYTERNDALAMASTLSGIVPWVKLGLELFTKEGSQILQTLKHMGYKVMLDLKFFDIPNTVAGAVRTATQMGADMITVHTLGGERMVRAAVESAKAAAVGTRPLIFGITVLTSFDEGELPQYTGSLTNLASDLAFQGAAWGLDGVVSSGHEVRTIKGRCPNILCLTPGIRESNADTVNDDQRRIMTPKEAVQAGADFLVVGRPITRATNPAITAKAFRDTIMREAL